MDDETRGRVMEAFDRYTYRQLDDEELQEHLLTGAVIDDLETEGRIDEATEILINGL